jgi:hypothetical protein
LIKQEIAHRLHADSKEGTLFEKITAWSLRRHWMEKLKKLFPRTPEWLEPFRFVIRNCGTLEEFDLQAKDIFSLKKISEAAIFLPKEMRPDIWTVLVDNNTEV